MIAAVCIIVPTVVHAGTLTTIAGKFKSVFVPEKPLDEETVATSQTMTLFKPVIVDSTTTKGANLEQDLEKESLKAVSGSLRISTEDIDFPTTDTISVYEVKKGDTIQDVAKLFDVSVNTIMWANALKSRTISQGDTLIILPITGIKHTVKKGDTITTIAKKYKADEQDVASYNGLGISATLALGDTVIVPDGEIEAVQPNKPKTVKNKKPKVLNSYTYSAPQGFLARPFVGGRRSQGIHGHNGIDIAGTMGAPVLASASGQVIAAKNSGYNGGYGKMIIISHDNGVQTIYAHLQEVYVTKGQKVIQGETIAALGNTGKSTGPHLHFEVRGAKNPF